MVSQGAAGHSYPFILPPDILSPRICILSPAWPYRSLLSGRFLCEKLARLQTPERGRGAALPPLPHWGLLLPRAHLVPGNQTLDQAAPGSGQPFSLSRPAPCPHVVVGHLGHTVALPAWLSPKGPAF